MPEVSVERLHFSLTPQQVNLRLSRDLGKKIGRKYETAAQLVLKWSVGSSVKGKTQYSVVISDGTVPGQSILTMKSNKAGGPPEKSGDDFAFDAKMRCRSELRGSMYKKKVLQVTLKLLMQKQDSKPDPKGSTPSFSIAECLTDLRDLIPEGGCDGAPHNLRLQMERPGEYMDVHCIVENLGMAMTNVAESSLENSSMLSTLHTPVASFNSTIDGARSHFVSFTTPPEVVQRANGKGVIGVIKRKLSKTFRDDEEQSFAFISGLGTMTTSFASKANNSTLLDRTVNYEVGENSTVEDAVLTMAPLPEADLPTIYKFCEDARLTLVAHLCQKNPQLTTVLGHFSPLKRILTDGLSCEQQFTEADPICLFSQLFPRRTPAVREAALMAAIHQNRRDTDYPIVHTFAKTPLSLSHTAYYTASYGLKLPKSRSTPAEEYCVVVASRDRVVAHAFHIAPNAPLVGSDARLEVLVEIMTGGLIRVALLPVVPSKVRLLLRSQLNARMTKMETAVRQALAAAATALSGARTTAPSPSLSPHGNNASTNQPSSSMDPNAWRRLRDAAILPQVSFVEATLRRMLSAPLPNARVCESYVQTLEQIAVFHRHHMGLVRLSTEHLVRCADLRGAEALARASPLLAPTLRQVFALHRAEWLFPPGETFTASVETFLSALDAATHAVREERRRELSSVRDVWHALRVSLGDRQAVTDITRRMRSQRTVATAPPHCRLLHAVLALHMDCPDIAHAVLGVVVHSYMQGRTGFLSELQSVSADFAHALTRGLGMYRAAILRDAPPSTGAAFDTFADALARRVAAVTAFERLFGAVMEEEPMFLCKVRLVRPRTTHGSPLHECVERNASLSSTCTELGEANPSLSEEATGELLLAITASFFCLGHSAVPLARVRRLRMCRHWFVMPAVRLVLSEAAEESTTPWANASEGMAGAASDATREVVFVIWRRSEFVGVMQQVISDLEVVY